MVRQQLWLPRVDSQRFVVEKFPQPKNPTDNLPKKYEILYHPYNLKFRGNINKWLLGFYDTKEILNALDIKRRRIVKLYFFPQDGRWLNQEMLMERVDIKSKKKLKKILVESLLAIWNTIRV